MKTKILIKVLAVAIAASTIASTPGLVGANPKKLLGNKTNRSQSSDSSIEGGGKNQPDESALAVGSRQANARRSNGSAKNGPVRNGFGPAGHGREAFDLNDLKPNYGPELNELELDENEPQLSLSERIKREQNAQQVDAQEANRQIENTRRQNDRKRNGRKQNVRRRNVRIYGDRRYFKKPDFSKMSESQRAELDMRYETESEYSSDSFGPDFGINKAMADFLSKQNDLRNSDQQSESDSVGNANQGYLSDEEHNSNLENNVGQQIEIEMKNSDFNKLLLEDFLKGEKKKSLLDLMKYFARENSENGFFQEKVKRVIDRLLAHSCDNGKRNLVAGFVADLAAIGGLGQIRALERNKICSIIKILQQCADNEAARVSVAGALIELQDKGFFEKYFEAYFDNDSEFDGMSGKNASEEVKNINGLLFKCVMGDANSKYNVALFINRLSACESLKKNISGEIFGFLAGLGASLANEGDDEIKGFVAESTANLTEKSQTCQHFDYKVEETLNWLNSCVKSKCAKKHVASAVSDLLANRLLSNNSENDISKVISLLQDCVDDRDSMVYISMAISSLLKQNVPETFPTQANAIFSLAEKCVDDESSRKYIADFVGILFSEKRWKAASEGEVSYAIGLLEKCSKSDDARENVAGAIGGLIKYFSSFGVDRSKIEAKIGKILEILNECCSNAGAKEMVSEVVKQMVQFDFVTKFSQNAIFGVMDMLDRCAISIQSRKNLVETVCSLIYGQSIDYCSKDQFLKVVDIFGRYFGDQNTKTRIAGSVCLLLSITKYEFSKDEILKIIDVLDECVDGADAAKVVALDVCKIFKTSSKNQNFNLDETCKILNLLERCANFSAAKEQVVDAIDEAYTSNLFKECLKSAEAQMVCILQICADNQYSNNQQVTSYAQSVLKKLC